MQTILHKASSRGHADHGWLNSYHSFSFAGYYEPSRIHFGALRVLNDDSVAAGMGFGKHPHDNMEIISIPLEGALEHSDNMGNVTVIRKGDVQIMSAGTGVVHSEKNHSNAEPVKFLQVWIFPDKKNVQPRYDQKSFSEEDMKNQFLTVVSPIGNKDGVNIHQNAWFSLSKLDADKYLRYNLHTEGNGVYAFILDGTVHIHDTELKSRDGLGISETNSFDVKALTDSFVLLMEIPMGNS